MEKNEVTKKGDHRFHISSFRRLAQEKRKRLKRLAVTIGLSINNRGWFSTHCCIKAIRRFAQENFLLITPPKIQTA
ncbi:MAG: hypothetical protein NT091_01605 [Candidatus Falkowbacteria bacterium]|nr:hypothetical protein [Candidatus Falkowbacteria bacterium]